MSEYITNGLMPFLHSTEPPECAQKEWLTVAEAAEYAGISLRKLCDLGRNGKLARESNRKGARYSRAGLDQLIKPVRQEIR